jgi:hypothetical protein
MNISGGWNRVYCPVATEVGFHENGRRLLRSRSGLRFSTGSFLRADPPWHIQLRRCGASPESLWWLGEQWGNDKVLLEFLGGLRGLTAPQRASGRGPCLRRLTVLCGVRSPCVSRPIRRSETVGKRGYPGGLGWQSRMEIEQWPHPPQRYER